VSGRPLPTAIRRHPPTADALQHAPPPPPPWQRSSGPLPLTHGGSVATPRQTAPIAGPAIQVRPSRLPHPFRQLSGSSNRCGAANGPISPIQRRLSTARAALEPQTASTWAEGGPPQARQTYLDSPPPLRFPCERCVGAMQTKKVSNAFLSVHASARIACPRRGSAFKRSGPDRQFLVSD